MAATKETPGKKDMAPVGEAKRMAPTRDFPFFMSRMRDEFERMFERMAHAWPDVDFNEKWSGGLTLDDMDDKVVVRAESPGFEPGDFDVRVSDGQLTLRANRKEETKGKEGKVRETRTQECFETLTLPRGVDTNKVDAKYVDGVLTVTIPKTEDAKAKRIVVKGN